MAITANYSNTDFTSISQFVAETLEASFAPFSALGLDVSAQIPTGKSVRVYKIGTTVSESIFNGQYVPQSPSTTGIDVSLTHFYKSWILQDTDLIDAGDLSFTAKAQISSHARQLAGDVQRLFIQAMTGSANAALSSSLPNASWGYNAVFSASIAAGNGNWATDNTNAMILHPSAYRKVLGDPAVSNNYALAALAVDKKDTVALPLLGFNIVEGNSFPGTPTSASQVVGVAVREGGTSFVLRNIAVDPAGDGGVVEQVTQEAVPGAFAYTLKSFRRPELGGRQYILEVQAGAKVADPSYVMRLLNT